MPAIPTVLVNFRKGKGWGRINEDDFDPELHELLEGEVETPTPSPKEPKESDEPKAEGSEEKPLEDMGRAELVERLEKAGGDLAGVKGTGKNGAIKNVDIVKAIQEAEAKKGE